MSRMTLYIGNKNYSSWSLRGWLAAKRSSADFDEVMIPLFVDGSRDSLRARSPSGKVPALECEGITVWDSLAIGEFLAERFPEAGLWPADAAQRAHARAVSAEMHSGFMALRRGMPMNVRADLPGRGGAEGIEADIARVHEIWRDCRSQAGTGGPFLFGAFTLADAFYAPVVSRFRTYHAAMDATCAAYADAVWQMPEMQEWVTAAAAEPHVLPQFEV